MHWLSRLEKSPGVTGQVYSKNLQFFVSYAPIRVYLCEDEFNQGLCSSLVSLPDLANSFSTNAYQEMKVEVTEVPVSHLLPERYHTFKGKYKKCLIISL